mgnify:FL=1
MAAEQDYVSFARDELKQRQDLQYPPFVTMLKMTVHHESETKALELAQRFVNALEAFQLESKVPYQILGPFPALVPVVNRVWRVNVLIKSQHMKPIKDWIRASGFWKMEPIF